MGKFGERINNLIEQDQYEEARRLIRIARKWLPNDHWLLDRLSLTHYEQREYGKALNWIRKAYASKEARTCPTVMFDYAGTLDMLGRKREAIKMYLRLYRMGEKAIADEGKTIVSGRSKCQWDPSELGVIADCAYRLALCYEDVGNLAQAKFWLLKHMHLREQQIPNIYPQQEVVKLFHRLFPPRTASENSARLITPMRAEIAPMRAEIIQSC